jgi:hypothetical protein
VQILQGKRKKEKSGKEGRRAEFLLARPLVGFDAVAGIQ